MKKANLLTDAAKSRERGGILIVATLVIVVMLIVAIPFLFKLSAGYRSTERGAKALAALNLAEAGVDKVMWSIDPKTSPSGVDLEAIQDENGNPVTRWGMSEIGQAGFINNLKAGDNATIMGNVHLLITAVEGTAPNPQFRTLDSTGLVPFTGGNTVNRTVRVRLQRDYKSIFDVGFFVDEFFYIRNGFTMDAYDSRDGGYGVALPEGGTNSLLPDVIFGSNSYIVDTSNGQESPADSTWIIAQSQNNHVYGTVMAGGDASETSTPPDPALLEDVIQTPTGILAPGEREVMKQQYDLPWVDVYNLPPKEVLPAPYSVGEWFYEYNATDVDSSGRYYQYRFDRPPLSTELLPEHLDPLNGMHTFTGSGTLRPENSGVYTSFVIGGKPATNGAAGTSGTLTISGGNVVIYVTSYGDVTKPASFYMGRTSSINIDSDSSLTLILGNASFSVEQGYQLNSVGNPPEASRLVILGTHQFALPANAEMNKVDGLKNAMDADNQALPGLVYLEHGQGGLTDPQGNGTIYAAMYVPEAHVTGTGQGGNHLAYYGALISKSMDFKNIVEFHYDKALADLKIIDGGFDYWRIINWVEIVN